MAAGELGCHSATISSDVLKELSELPYKDSEQPGERNAKPIHPYKDAIATPARLAKLAGMDPLTPGTWTDDQTIADVDYLANNGANLDAANEADQETKKRLAQSLQGFIEAEKLSQAMIETLMEAV